MVKDVSGVQQSFQTIAYSPYTFAFLAGISAFSIFPKKPPLLKYLFQTTFARYVALFLLIWITTGREYFFESLLVTLGFVLLEFAQF